MEIHVSICFFRQPLRIRRIEDQSLNNWKKKQKVRRKKQIDDLEFRIKEMNSELNGLRSEKCRLLKKRKKKETLLVVLDQQHQKSLSKKTVNVLN